MVRTHSQRRPALPPLRALQFLLHAGAAQLSLSDRTQPILAHASLTLVRRFCWLHFALWSHRLAHLRRNLPARHRTSRAGDCPPSNAHLDCTCPLAGACHRGFGTSAGGNYPSHTGRRGYSFSLDRTSGRLSTQFHHLLRIAATLPTRDLRAPADPLARLHGLPPLARSRKDEPAPRDRPVRLRPLHLLHGMSRRTGAPQATPPSPYRFLRDSLTGRCAGRPLRRSVRPQRFPRVLRIPYRPGSLRLDDRHRIRARVVERTAPVDADRHLHPRGSASRVLLLPARHHVPDGRRL